ncbi:MAG: 6,7-dimethyl-8-ribityllumazine synthase [Paludibacter sp.]|nr:6,7-dimethyl-8-ribityllumazine synthase [Paludibacter sp.]
MATQYQNLSGYDPDLMPEAEVLEQQSYAIAVADWNPEVTHALLQGAIDTLVKHGVVRSNIKIVHVPGTFELTFAARQLISDSLNPSLPSNYNAVIVLGCVVQGDTPHFTYVCEGVTYGIAHLNTMAGTPPVVFGVLTTATMQQATDRAGGIHGNKGVEAAITAVKMANIIW